MNKLTQYKSQIFTFVTIALLMTYGIFPALTAADSKIGYNKDNCVPCCSSCNYMKHTSNHIEFLNRIDKIYKHLKLSS